MTTVNTLESDKGKNPKAPEAQQNSFKELKQAGCTSNFD